MSDNKGERCREGERVLLVWIQWLYASDRMRRRMESDFRAETSRIPLRRGKCPKDMPAIEVRRGMRGAEHV